MRPFLLALALIAIRPVAAAPCPRDPRLPASVPLVPCPRLAVPSPCHWCPKGDTFLDLHYDQAPYPLATAWANALAAAGWKVTWRKGGMVIAQLGTQRVGLRFDAGRATDTTLVRMNHSP